MATYNLTINGKNQKVNAPENMPLLWVLRDFLRLTGTKYGCGLGVCGICKVHINGEAVNSCMVTVQSADGKNITTIEGLSENGNHPVQNAWKTAQVPQCGYCHGGQIMQAAAMLEKNPNPKKGEINETMSKVLCRCGTYPRIKKAIELAIKNK